MYRFANVDLSSFYLDLAKDRLYVDRFDSERRLCAIAIIYHALHALTLLIAPILPALAEEIFDSYRHLVRNGTTSVFQQTLLEDLPAVQVSAEDVQMVEDVRALRDRVNISIDEMRRQGAFGSSLQAELSMQVPTTRANRMLIQALKDDLADIMNVASVQIEWIDHAKKEEEDIEFALHLSQNQKCPRCRIHRKDINLPEEAFCARCTAIVVGRVE